MSLVPELPTPSPLFVLYDLRTMTHGQCPLVLDGWWGMLMKGCHQDRVGTAAWERALLVGAASEGRSPDLVQ